MREMSTEPPSEEALRLGHQPDYFRVRTILWAGLGFAVLVIAVVIAMAVFEWGMTLWSGNTVAHEEQGKRRRQYSPSINANQPQQLRTLRAAEEAVLTSYAWQDEQQAVARVPIERAMATLAERGLPAALPGFPTTTAEEAIPSAPPPDQPNDPAPDESGPPRPPAGTPIGADAGTSEPPDRASPPANEPAAARPTQNQAQDREESDVQPDAAR